MMQIHPEKRSGALRTDKRTVGGRWKNTRGTVSHVFRRRRERQLVERTARAGRVRALLRAHDRAAEFIFLRKITEICSIFIRNYFNLR